MLEIAIAVGTLISYVDPRMSTTLCGRVAFVGEGVAGEQTVWAVQVGGSRAFKAPLAQVTRGCPEERSAVAPPVPPARPVPVGSGRSGSP